MMSDAVLDAVCQLQDRSLRTCDTYALERIERALDELLRKPHEDAPVPYLLRSALGHAYETIERRKAIARQCELNAEGREAAFVEGAYDVVEVAVWVCGQSGLREQDRALLLQLAQGHDSETLAEKMDIPVTRMRERISRCRRQARQLWDAVEIAA